MFVNIFLRRGNDEGKMDFINYLMLAAKVIQINKSVILTKHYANIMPCLRNVIFFLFLFYSRKERKLRGFLLPVYWRCSFCLKGI